ncbi:hypothetical protein CN918_32220 [Priestia megaterium]|nr:hypothetical protein CN918_32220 [Priestia megaterium]
MKGLLIKEPWITHILNKEKIWEIRSSHTYVRGEIFLIRSGSGCIIGKATLADSFPLDEETYATHTYKHCIKDKLYEELPYKNPHVWVIQNAQWLEKPIPYQHKRGAVIWVNLP